MRGNFRVLLLLCIPVAAHAQNDPLPSLNIGDPAPPLRVRAWLKGTPVQRFEKGKLYVVEFWATWCQPCKAAMPHLSALAAEYKDKITIIGMDVYEKKTTPIEKVKAFVDSMGRRMDYEVAAEDSNFMEVDWFDASGERGIPKSFVVNAEGRLAWVGHPSKLAEVLPGIVNNTWDIKEALAKRNSDKRLTELDDSLYYELIRYWSNPAKPGHPARPDSALLAIDQIVRNEPKLKYAPRIAYHTFSSLLKTNPHKAFEYGKVVIITPTYEDPAVDIIIDCISLYTGKQALPAEIYLLGADAYQAEIDRCPYPEIIDIPKLYNNMAAWYWRAHQPLKAASAQQKAIEILKNKKSFSAAALAEYNSRLRKYEPTK